MTTFVLRLNRLFIHSNRENPHFLDPFNIFRTDLAEVKLYSFITTDNQGNPDIDALLAEQDPAKRKELLKLAIVNVAASRILTTVQNVTDDHMMTFGPRGFALYQANTIPEMVHWSFVAMESDEDIRNQGKALKSVLEDAKLDGFLEALLVLIGKASNPAYAAAIEIAKFVAKAAANAMLNNKDDQVGIYYTSHARAEDYPHGEFKINGVWDLSNNMRIDYSIMCFD
jgi:hypothetical protein